MFLLSIYGCDQVFMFLSFPFTYCFNIIFWCFVIIPIKFTFYNIILQHSTKFIYQSFQTSRCYRRLLDFFFQKLWRGEGEGCQQLTIKQTHLFKQLRKNPPLINISRIYCSESATALDAFLIFMYKQFPVSVMT